MKLINKRILEIKVKCKITHSRVNHHQLRFSNWNILILTEKELELVEEAKRYHSNIVGISSTKRLSSEICLKILELIQTSLLHKLV